MLITVIVVIEYMKIELIMNKKNPDPEQVSWMQVRFPNQNDRLWITARYFFILGARIGVVCKYD